jgi:hypothetical protein
MSRIRRIIFGEPETKKQWTVWYYDNSISSRILKFLFGTRGCYRVDADNISYLMSATGFFLMYNEEADGSEYIWTLQIEKYKMNFGYKQSQQEMEMKYEELKKENITAYAEELAKVVPTNQIPTQGNMFG